MDSEQEKTNNHRRKINLILLNSYLIFLLAVVLGTFLDPLLKYKMFTDTLYQNAGFVMLIVGSILIYWAQSVSSVSKHKMNEKNGSTYIYFNFGPYKYFHNPTHLGLFVATLGFSLIINSLFGVILNIISYCIVRFFFIKQEEKLLELKYGQDYIDHEKKVKNWI
jgi:protein-S-isoprenylcysteine O-methyltransferase Ste14